MEELFKDATLRDIIRLKFRTYSEFGDKIGWSRQKLDYKLANPTTIDLSEAKLIADTLGVELSAEMIQIFLRTV